MLRYDIHDSQPVGRRVDTDEYRSRTRKETPSIQFNHSTVHTDQLAVSDKRATKDGMTKGITSGAAD